MERGSSIGLSVGAGVISVTGTVLAKTAGVGVTDAEGPEVEGIKACRERLINGKSIYAANNEKPSTIKGTF